MNKIEKWAKSFIAYREALKKAVIACEGIRVTEAEYSVIPELIALEKVSNTEEGAWGALLFSGEKNVDRRRCLAVELSTALESAEVQSFLNTEAALYGHHDGETWTVAADPSGRFFDYDHAGVWLLGCFSDSSNVGIHPDWEGSFSRSAMAALLKGNANIRNWNRLVSIRVIGRRVAWPWN